MSKFYALDMAKEVIKHPQIRVTKGFLGYFKQAFYAPTASKVNSFSNYYTENDARLIKNLIDGPEEDFSCNMEALDKVDCIKNAPFRLDLCISHDSQFIAMQLNHVVNGVVTHITPIRYFEGQMALKVENIF